MLRQTQSRPHPGSRITRSVRLVAAICIGWSLLVRSGLCDDDTAVTSNRWAILIGCEKYQHAAPLFYTINDVKQLSSTLRNRAGYEGSHILEMTDGSEVASEQPLRTNLLEQVLLWLKKPGPQDSMVVYFSGHGFRDSEGKMYLAPIDVDPANPAATGIPVEWLREQIAACPARIKVLILDACHAGSEKGAGNESISARVLGQAFSDLEKVVTIASSTAEQKSQLWPDRKQSLFSYWLNQGLKGHADSSGDGAVDIDELYQYVETNVSRTSETILGRAQTPVRIIRSGTLGSPVVGILKPQTLVQTLSEMSEQLANALIERRLGSIGIPEFANLNTGGEQILGGVFGRYCAEELENRLVERCAGKFSVVEGKRLTKLLRDRNLGLEDLGSAPALKDLSDRAGGMPVIVEGTLRGRQGAAVTLRCKLVETRGDKTLATIGGVAKLSESEWAMLGRSVVVKTDDRRPVSDRPVQDQVIERMDDRANGANPMLDDQFPFRIWIMVDNQVRQGMARGNDYFVPVRKGEVLEILVETRSPQITLMRLLVDGLNTLPELPKKGLAQEDWGQRVNLNHANHWELDPARGISPTDPMIKQGVSARAKVFAIRGFVTATGDKGKLKEFVVVDAEKSLAGRQQYTDQLGIITAAFYAPQGTSRGNIGIGAGRERDERIGKTHGYQCGNMLGAITIHYIEADALRQATR